MFNGHFSWTSRISQYQNVSILDFIVGEDDGGGGDNWSYKTCRAAVKLPPPTNQHLAFYRPDALSVTQAAVPKHCREKYHIPHSSLPGVLQPCL